VKPVLGNRVLRVFSYAVFFSLTLVIGMTGCSSNNPPPPIQVGLSSNAASVQAGIGTQSFTAKVQNDSQNKGVTWALSGAGCTGAACGSLSATSSASGTPITYTAPSSPPNPTGVTLTATSTADTTKSKAATITVTAPVAVTVAPTPVNVQFNAIQFFTRNGAKRHGKQGCSVDAHAVGVKLFARLRNAVDECERFRSTHQIHRTFRRPGQPVRDSDGHFGDRYCSNCPRGHYRHAQPGHHGGDN